jgi:hypothetical protein
MPETNLLPTVDVPEFIDSTNNYDTEYRPSLRWDLKKGDFVQAASGRVPYSEGRDAYQVWCVKCVATERLSCLAYADDIGSEMEAAVRLNDRKAIEIAIKRTITEALMVNPRTQKVDGFTFSWEPDSVHVSFYVTGVDNDQFEVETDIDTEG